MRISSPLFSALTLPLTLSIALTGCMDEEPIGETIDVEIYDEKTDELYHMRLDAVFESEIRMSQGREHLRSLVRLPEDDPNTFQVRGRLVQVGAVGEEIVEVSIEKDQFLSRDVMMLMLYRDPTRGSYTPIYTHIGHARVGLYRKVHIDPAEGTFMVKGREHSLSADEEWYEPQALRIPDGAELAFFAVPLGRWWVLSSDNHTFESILEVERYTSLQDEG